MKQKTNYVSPEMRTIEIRNDNMLCSSIVSLQEDRAMVFGDSGEETVNIWK